MASFSDVAVVDALSPFDTKDDQLVVASYNLLAPVYVRPVDKRTGAVQPFAAFAWVPDAEIAWPARREKLQAQLRACASSVDVLCLQEVEYEANAAGELAPPAYLIEALGEGWTVVSAKAGLLKRNAQRNDRVLGKAAAVAAAVAVGRGWEVDWVADGNGTTRVLVGVRKGARRVAVASAHLDAGSEESTSSWRRSRARARAWAAARTCAWSWPAI